MNTVSRSLSRWLFVLAVAIGWQTPLFADLVCHWPLDEDFLNLENPDFDGYLPKGSIVEFTDVVLEKDGFGPLQPFAAQFTGAGTFVQTDYPGIGGNDPRSFTCWIKTTTVGANDFLGYGVPTNSLKWHMRVNTGAAQGLVGGLRTEFQGGQNVGTDVIDDGRWHHVAAVFPEGATTGAEIVHYVDGELQGRTGNGVPLILTDINNPFYNLTIGLTRQSVTANRWFNGQIADVRVYDHGLTAQNIVEVMNDEDLTEPVVCTTMSVTCEASPEDNSFTANLTLEPEGCLCSVVELSANGEVIASSPVADGVVSLPLDLLCSQTPGEEVELTFTCANSKASAVCTFSCPERQGLVARWPLNEGAGEVFEDVQGDSDGSLAVGATVTWVEGPPTQDFAVEFSGDNSWIQTNFPGIGRANPRTITAWVRTVMPETQQVGIISWGQDVLTRKWHIRTNTGAGEGVLGALRVEINGGSVVGTKLLNDGEWHHIAVVVGERASMMSDVFLFVDGELETRSGVRESVLDTNNGPGARTLEIGRRVTGGGVSHFFPGAVADVRVFDEGLSAQNIMEVMNDDELSEPIACTSMSLNCDTSIEDRVVTSSVSLEPAGCECSAVVVSANGTELGTRELVEGSLTLSLDELCSRSPGDDIELTVTCRDTEISASCTISCPDRQGLVAHWPLSAGVGELFEELVDGNDGFLIEGSTVEWVEGPPGQQFAVEFSGNLSWIQTDFAGIGGPNPRTVAAWIRTTMPGTLNSGMIAWGQDSSTRKWHIRLNNTAGNGAVGALRAEINGGYAIGTTPLNDGEWHHIAVVVPEDASSTTDILHYVDGQLEAMTGVNPLALNTNNGAGARTLEIGRRVNGNGTANYFPGAMADVRIYDEGLDAAAILKLATPTVGPTEICDNEIDDDGDGLIDCLDDDCEACDDGPTFQRADADASGTVNITDGIFILNFLFLGGSTPTCQDAADADDSGSINITDGIFVLNFLFLGGGDPPAPFENCGIDPTKDATDCSASSCQ
ncbi:MAG: LamG-like jellyroll fold domain-containing protein [Planctomycetota bacterium]